MFLTSRRKHEALIVSMNGIMTAQTMIMLESHDLLRLKHEGEF